MTARKLLLRRALAWLPLLLAAELAGCNGPAGEYPTRTVVIVCPWAAGGGTDRVARFLADQLQRELKQPVVVQNQTGGSGASGHVAGARARPDGYTITMGTFELSTMRAMGISDLTYRDFQPLAQMNADAAAIIVRADAPWKSLGEFLNEVRASPGRLKMSGTAAGGAWDLARAGLLLAADLPVESVVWAPSQGSAPSLVELLGGHIDAVCCSLPEAQSQLEAGELRVLCVMAGERLADYPHVPTAKEGGVDWEAVGWRGFLLPKQTPEEIRRKLDGSLTRVLESDAYREFMAANRFGITIRHGDDFTAFLDEQEQRWSGIIDAAGYAADGGPARVVTSSDVGPWFFPTALAAGLVAGTCLIGVASIWRKIRLQRPAEVQAPAGSWLRFARERGKLDIVLLVAALAVYLLSMPWIGFFPGTLLLSTLMMARLGVRWWQALPLSAILLVVVYLLFVWQFRVVLPQSPWWQF